MATMPASMADLLRDDLECEDLLECLHGLKDLDRDCFTVLVESEDPLTVDAVAEAVDRERSTAYRAIKRLDEAGLIEQEQVNYEDGGYYHVYRPRNPDQVADEMQRLLNDWYATVGNLIHEFRSKYSEQGPPEQVQ